MTRDLREVIVVEDKSPFIELQLKEALYRQRHQPAVVGKQDGSSTRSCPCTAPLTATPWHASWLHDCRVHDLPLSAEERTARLHGRGDIPLAVDLPERTPVLLLGLPAQRLDPRPTTTSWSGLGIGCHIMVGLDGDGPGPPRRHDPDGRRGGAVDRPGAVHRRPALRPEPGRRDVLPLGVPGRAGRGGRRAWTSPTSCCSTTPWP